MPHKTTTIEQRIDTIRALHTAYMAKQDAAEKRAERRKTRKETDNELHWTDGRKFAAQAVGETFHATTRLDNDWGDF